MRYTSIIILFLLCVRLAHIALISGSAYETMAQSQQNKKQLVSIKRGDVCDAKGVKLTDGKNLSLYLDSSGNIGTEAEGAVYEIPSTLRFSPVASHIIGYTDAEGNGKSGIESVYNDFLKTSSGRYLTYMADASGKPVRDYVLYDEEGEKHTVKLTIDADIQNICETVMDEYINKGAAVVLDVSTFDVLASVSRPDFEADKISSYAESENGELLNRALLPYNAGSVFKIVTAAASLEKNKDNVYRKFNCKGVFCPDKKHKFYCHETKGHGMLRFDEAFALSCNCAFYALASDVGANSIIDMALDFGFGSAMLNSPLGESEGNMPIRSEYSPAETLNIAIGQGEILVTPMQCAAMVATVAGGGIRRDINIVSEFEDDGIGTDAKNKGEVRVISEDTALMLSEMMRKCVTDGTGIEAMTSSVNIAGKTGSAETGIMADGEMQVHGWFCGFFPAEAPKYALVVFSEGGKSGSMCVEPFVKMAEGICAIN